MCNLANGLATANSTGGTSPYTYLWSNGTTLQSATVASGTYTVTVTDIRSCTTSATAIVTMKALPVITAFTASPSSFCSGTPTTLTVNATGGTVTSSFSSGTINLAIPDNNPNGASSTLAVSTAIVLNAASKLSVTLNFGTIASTTGTNREHTWLGDLKVTLATPGGTTIVFDRPGVPVSGSGNNADMNGSYTFTTTAAALLPQLSTDAAVVGGNVVSGSYKPSDSANPDAVHS